jgi:hypothetical protein
MKKNILQEEINKSKVLMGYNSKKTLTENQNLLLNSSEIDVVFTDWLSPDEKFIIFLDEVYDLENKVRLGNIWENFDLFKNFIRHSFDVATNVPQVVKESINKSLSKLILTESTQDMTKLKPFIKQLMLEGTWNPFNKDFWSMKNAGELGTEFKDWTVKQAKDAYEGTKDFLSTSWEGLKKAGIAISKGDWDELMNLIGKGALYVARKLRAALYHPIGIAIDAILIATGIGKGVQWIPWAIVVALDAYEVITGDYEDPELPTWLRVLFYGLDILGLVLAGAAAKAGRVGLEVATAGVRTEAEMAEFLAKNPELRGTVESMAKSAEKAPGLLRQGVDYLKNTFPAGAKFIEFTLGSIEKFITFIVDGIKSVLPSAKQVVKGTSAAGKSLGTYFGVEKVIHAFQEKNAEKDQKELEKEVEKDIDKLTGGQADYSDDIPAPIR